MSAAATAPETTAARDLRELYARYKRLALAAGAALILEGADDGALAAEAQSLVGDCEAARARAPHLRPQLDACAEAAAELHALLGRAAGDEPADAALERARTSHRRLRREVWSVLPCEYVPCCAEHIHHER